MIFKNKIETKNQGDDNMKGYVSLAERGLAAPVSANTGKGGNGAGSARSDLDKGDERILLGINQPDSNIPEAFQKVQLLNYAQQWMYLLKNFWKSKILLLYFLAMFAVPIVVLTIIGFILGGISLWGLAIPIFLDLAYVCIFIYALLYVFSERGTTGEKKMGILTITNTPQPEAIILEGDYVRIRKLVDCILVDVAVVPVNQTIEGVKAAGNAYLDVTYSFTAVAIPRALLNYRDAGGKGFIDVIDGTIEAKIRQVYSQTSLDDIQSMSPELLRRLTAEILDALSPRWRDFNPDADHLINADNPIYLYNKGVKITSFRIDHPKPDKRIVDAQLDAEKEIWELIADSDNLDALLLNVQKTLRQLNESGSYPNPWLVFERLLKQQNLKSGFNDQFSGLAEAVTAYGMSKMPNPEIIKDMSAVIESFLWRSIQERDRLMEIALDRLGNTGKKPKGGRK